MKKEYYNCGLCGKPTDVEVNIYISYCIFICHDCGTKMIKDKEIACAERELKYQQRQEYLKTGSWEERLQDKFFPKYDNEEFCYIDIRDDEVKEMYNGIVEFIKKEVITYSYEPKK